MLNQSPFTLLFTLLFLTGREALACPLCHTGTGQAVRAGILDGDFYFNLFAAAAPFPVLAIVVAILYWGPEL